MVCLQSDTQRLLKEVELLESPVTRKIHFNEIVDLLEELQYPVERTAAAEQMSDVTMLLADGERDLDNLISKTDSEQFESVDHLFTELQSTLPREAVGEPYQSEGEG